MENTSRNFWLIAAAALMGLTTVVHVLAGGPESYAPLRVSQLNPIVVATLSVVWHMVTLMLALQTLALAHLTTHQNSALSIFLVALNGGSGVLFIGYGLADFGGLWVLPQWIAFFAVGALILIGRKAQ